MQKNQQAVFFVIALALHYLCPQELKKYELLLVYM